MVASIIPLRRLPSHIQMLTYAVPKELEPDIREGQLVTIPFRASHIFGIVFAMAKEDDRQNKKNSRKTIAIKPIHSLVQKEPLLSHDGLFFMQAMAAAYHTAIGTIATMMLLPLQKRKLKKIMLTPFAKSEKRNALTLPSFYQYADELQHASHIKKYVSETTLILVPETYRIDAVLALLTEEQRNHAVLWHSNLTDKEKFDRWLAVRNGEKTIVIGTRGAVFLPFPKLNTIILDYEYDENHKHWDQAPRFHVKDAVHFLAARYGAKEIWMGQTPSLDAYFRCYKKGFENSILNLAQISPAVIDMAVERRGGNKDPLAERIFQDIKNAVGDIFIYINRRGAATSTFCNDCGWTAACAACGVPLILHEKEKKMHCHYCRTASDMPTACQSCGSQMIRSRGAGIEEIEAYIKKTFPNIPHRIVRIDSEIGTAELPKEKDGAPRLIIGTQMALPYIRWNDTRVCAVLGIDREIAIPEYRAEENAWHLLHQIACMLPKKSICYLQTHSSSQLLFRSFLEPERFYRTALNIRRALHYPPYTYLVRYFYGHANAGWAKREAMRVHANLSHTLTKERIDATLVFPIDMHPKYYRKKFWYTILLRLNPAEWQTDIRKLNAVVPSSWKVDPNPISILSP